MCSQRGFATAAATKVTPPPVRLFGLDGRYATALFQAGTADKSGAAGVEAELKTFKEMMKSNAQFSQFVLDPTVSRLKKSNGLREIFKTAGFSETTQNFVGENF